MKRTASEVIRELESRIATLERVASFKELEKHYLKFIPLGGSYFDLEEMLQNKGIIGKKNDISSVVRKGDAVYFSAKSKDYVLKKTVFGGVEVEPVKSRTSRLERVARAHPLQEKASKAFEGVVDPLKEKIQDLIDPLKERYEDFEGDARVKEDEDNLGSIMGDIQSSYLHLVESAMDDLDDAVEKVIKTLGATFEAVKELESGLDEMDGHLKKGKKASRRYRF